jgi:hypothetical protein
MNAADIIAFTADADCYCPDCAAAIYGAAACGHCPDCGEYLYPAADRGECERCGRDYSGDRLTDNEGNEVHPIFAESIGDYTEAGLYCGHCREEIVEPEPPPRSECAHCATELEPDDDPHRIAGDGLLCEECYRDAIPRIQGSNWLALSILDWHGGQGSPSYAVGSTWHALREVPITLAWEAHRELVRVPGADKVAAALAQFLDGSGYPPGGEP